MERNSPALELQWSSMLDALRDYRAFHGSADVPRSFRTKDGRGLGAWLHRQRSLHAAGRLPSDRAERLEAAGVTWRLVDREKPLQALRSYLDVHGDLRVPADHVTADGLPLGTWVQSRRVEHRRSPQRTLELWPELACLPFVWEVDQPTWETSLAALRRYVRDYGESRVPHWYVTPDGLRLGKWLDSRRTDFRAGRLPADRVEALEAEGVEWTLRTVTDTRARDAREDAHFMAMLSVTVDWVRRHDGATPPVRTVHDGRAIGRWYGRLQRQLRNGELPERRRRLLEQHLHS